MQNHTTSFPATSEATAAQAPASQASLAEPSPLTVPAAKRARDIYEKLRTSIVTGEFRPNEPLIEDDLAMMLGVSRTPIRESLQRLAMDGLIVPRRRGWAVKEHSQDEIRENYEVRAGMEGLAARYAALRGSDTQIDEIAAINEQRRGLGVADLQERVRLNRLFHDTIIATSGNAKLRELIFQAWNFYFNRQIARATGQARFAAVQIEHDAIVAAIRARDAASAEQAMRTHVMNAFNAWLSLSDGASHGVLPFA
jgi:DNA-binding GntR family transcriptional regulator